LGVGNPLLCFFAILALCQTPGGQFASQQQRGATSLPARISISIVGRPEPGEVFEAQVRVTSLVDFPNAEFLAIAEPGLSVLSVNPAVLGTLTPGVPRDATFRLRSITAGSYVVAFQVQNDARKLHQRVERIRVDTDGGGIVPPAGGQTPLIPSPGGTAASPSRQGSTEFTDEDRRMAVPRSVAPGAAGPGSPLQEKADFPTGTKDIIKPPLGNSPPVESKLETTPASQPSNGGVTPPVLTKDIVGTSVDVGTKGAVKAPTNTSPASVKKPKPSA
jgi:hypothetical protein